MTMQADPAAMLAEPQWLLDLRVVALELLGGDNRVDKSAHAVAATLKEIADRAGSDLSQQTARVEALPTKENIEALAAFAHSQWTGWMRYLFSRTERLPGGEFVLSGEWAERWLRQMAAPYAELSEAKKDSDRAEARGMLAALQAQPDGDAKREEET